MNMRALFIAALLLPGCLWANVGGKLNPAPLNSHDTVSIQRGARHFVNYCLNCHSANYMRYNRLQDLGLTEKQIKDNLLFTADKVGEPMTIALRPADAKQWFGVAPPDLSVIARARGGDWLYAYLKGFYRDDSRPSGWNNTVFPQVGMPHVLYQLQGEQILHLEKTKNAEGHDHEEATLTLERPGTMNAIEYDRFVTDMVNYLVYMGEPKRNDRVRLGMYVMLFLGVLFVLAYLLKKEYWKDVH